MYLFNGHILIVMCIVIYILIRQPESTVAAKALNTATYGHLISFFPLDLQSLQTSHSVHTINIRTNSNTNVPEFQYMCSWALHFVYAPTRYLV